MDRLVYATLCWKAIQLSTEVRVVSFWILFHDLPDCCHLSWTVWSVQASSSVCFCSQTWNVYERSPVKQSLTLAGWKCNRPCFVFVRICSSFLRCIAVCIIRCGLLLQSNLPKWLQLKWMTHLNGYHLSGPIYLGSPGKRAVKRVCVCGPI